MKASLTLWMIVMTRMPGVNLAPQCLPIGNMNMTLVPSGTRKRYCCYIDHRGEDGIGTW